MTKNILYRFLIINTSIILFCIVNDNYLWLLNTQVAVVTSLFINLATFYSYKNNVNKQVDAKIQSQNDDLDYVDKIDDPYDLYSNDINEEIIEYPTKQQILEANKPIKQNNFNNLKSTFLSFASFYRFGAYVILILSFFYLNNNDLLNVFSYLFGFLIIPLSSLFVKVE